MDLSLYLESKRSVDDRALNRVVWERLVAELAAMRNRTLRVLDVGAGIGSGLDRMLSWGLFRSDVEVRYTGIDVEPAHVDAARRRWAAKRPGGKDGIEASWVAAELAEFAADAASRESFDLVTAHAFLDVVPLAPSVAALAGLCAPRGLLYCPITFDGETAFEPSHPLDGSVLERYHDSMRASGGDPCTGRRLARMLATPPFELLSLGGSDWTVLPTRSAGSTNTEYPAEEGAFLRAIVDMVERELGDEDAREWAKERRNQIEEKKLIYLAHQIDALARKNVDVAS